VSAQTWTYKQPAPIWYYNHVAGTGTDPAGVQRVYAIGGTKLNSIGQTVASATVYGYNPVNNTWSLFAAMPTPRADATATSLGGKIYVIGGLQVGFSNGLTAVEAYDTATNSWSTRAPLPTPAVRAASAAYGGKLYVFGGYQPNSGIELKSTLRIQSRYQWLDPTAKHAWSNPRHGSSRRVQRQDLCNRSRSELRIHGSH
jgi:N-acetylneuraminic acid mutarotase